MPTGRIHVLTNLRVLGYVFSPVSWWFLHDEEGGLALVVAEVNNTFGDSYCYVLDDLDQQGATVRARATKWLHVSPFLPVGGIEYAFVLSRAHGRVTAHPLMTLRTTLLIHVHALVLWLRRTPFHRRPAPPAQAVPMVVPSGSETWSDT